MLLREYETIYILRPDIPDEQMAQVNERLAGVLEREGARILRQDIWGKKKLAYEVKKHPKGVYVYLNYLSKPESIREIERNLKIFEAVLTYQTVKLAENVDLEHRLAEKEAEDQARAAAEARRQAEEAASAIDKHKEDENELEGRFDSAHDAEAEENGDIEQFASTDPEEE